MPTIVKPAVLVYQEYTLSPSELTEPLRAHISGPNAMLHRYSVADEKALIGVGAYDRQADTCYEWPGREAGSLIDNDSVRLFVDDAKLMYFEDLIGDASGGRGTVAPVSGHANWIRSSSVSFKANGTENPRSALLKDRDVQIGDKVYVRGVADPDGDCDVFELDTTVVGFAADAGDSEVEAARSDVNNQADLEEDTTIEQTAGPSNCLLASADGSNYDGLAAGFPSETYTIEVVKSSVAGCNAARLRVTSASGTDNQAEVQAEDFGTPTAIGTRGLEVTWNDNPSPCSASSEGITNGVFIVGQKWVVTVSQAFTAAHPVSHGTYTGPVDDVLVITVTKGGKWADLPQVSVTTVKGLDFSGPTTVTGPDVQIPVGTNGVALSFVSNDVFSSASASVAETLDGLRLGDKFYVTVLTAADGPIKTLILQDDLPDELEDAEDLDLRLFIQKNIEVTQNRISNPPLTNYDLEATQICVNAGMTAYDPTWTSLGVPQPLPVFSGELYVEYREFLATTARDVGSINNVADIDEIPGQLDEQNPLKWGVYKALAGSNGTLVKYTGVSDPADLDAWTDEVLQVLSGRDDVYNFVPLTYDRRVLELFHTLVGNESSPEAGNWKGMFVNLQAKTEKMIVGLSSANDQALHPTSTDGQIVLATVDDNPQATGQQYTRLRVPARNSGFITHGVQPGDIVRFLFTVDAFGATQNQEFVVDRVLSETSLLLLTGLDAPVTVAQKVEIWHSLTKNEIIADLKDQAQAYADKRVCATWPDLLGAAGITQPGYYLNCTLAGMASAVLPHQPLTNVQVPGFDDYARSTKFFNERQLDVLDDGGVWIVTEDRDGTPYTWHALTTDTTQLKTQEEMVRRNVDSISYLFLRRLRPFIGRTNATKLLVEKIRYEAGKIIKFLKTNGYTDDLGGQLIDGEVTTCEIHHLAADRILLVIKLTVPFPANVIELHLEI